MIFPRDNPGDDAQLRAVRRDLRGLLWLEWGQMGFALVILVAVATDAVMNEVHTVVALSLGVAVVFAIALIVLAVRVRLGQTLLYRDVYELEARRDEFAGAAHPYRSVADGGRGM